MIRQRRLLLWVLVIGLVLSLLASAGLVAWHWLPVWAPSWTVAHSPMVRPVLAATYQSPAKADLHRRLIAACQARLLALDCTVVSVTPFAGSQRPLDQCWGSAWNAAIAALPASEQALWYENAGDTRTGINWGLAVESRLSAWGAAATPALIDALADNETSVALAAVGHLAGRPATMSAGERRGLIALLADDRPVVRLRVLSLLDHSPLAEATPALRRLLGDPHPGVVFAALMCLSAHGDQSAIVDVAPLIDHPHRLIRLAACQLLGRLGDTALPARVRPWLAADDADLRCAALLAHSRSREPADRTFLRVQLDRDGEAVSRLAASGLIGLETLVSPARLLAAVDDDQLWVRVAAIEALGRLRTADAMPAVARALSDPVPPVSAAAAVAMARIDPPRALLPLRAASVLPPPVIDARWVQAMHWALAASGEPDPASMLPADYAWIAQQSLGAPPTPPAEPPGLIDRCEPWLWDW